MSSGELTQTELSPEHELHLKWLKELRGILKLKSLDTNGEAKVVETMTSSDRSEYDLASDQALNAALLGNVKRTLPDLIEEAGAIEGKNDQQESRLSDALKNVRSAIEKGNGEEAQRELRSYEIVIMRVSSEIVAQRNQTSIDVAYAETMNSSLTRTLDTLNKEANGIGGKTKPEEELLQSHVEAARKLLVAKDFEATQRELNTLEKSIAEVSTAVIERSRRKDVVASIQRRFDATYDYAQSITSRDLKINNPSQKLNEREANVHKIRTAAMILVETASKLEGSSDRSAFDNAVKAAIEKINELRTVSSKREQELSEQLATTKADELESPRKDILKKLPKEQFPQINKSLNDALDGYTNWKDVGRHKESLGNLATLEDGIRVCQEFIALVPEMLSSFKKLREDKDTLPAHLALLDNARKSALTEADSLLSNQLSAKDVFGDLNRLIQQLSQYNEIRRGLVSKLSEAQKTWKLVAPRVDSEQAKVGTTIEDMVTAPPPELDDIKDLAVTVNSAIDQVGIVQKTIRDFDEQAKKWRLLPRTCTGALAEVGKELSKSIEEEIKNGPTTGYAKVAEVLAESQRTKLESALSRLNKALKGGETATKSDRTLKIVYDQCVKEVLVDLNYAAPETFENAAAETEKLVEKMQASGVFQKLLNTSEIRVSKVQQELPNGCVILKGTLAKAKELVTSDPSRGTEILERELEPLAVAAGQFVAARKPLGKAFSETTKVVGGTPQAKILQVRKKEAEDLAVNANKAQDFTDAAQAIRNLLSLLDAVRKFGNARNRANTAYTTAAGLGHDDNHVTVLKEDEQSRLAIDKLITSVDTATDVPSYENCSRDLDKLAQVLAERLKVRQTEIQKHLRDKLTDPVELKGVLDKLVNAKGGGEALTSLSRSLGEGELVSLLKQLHSARKNTKPEEDVTDHVSSTLTQLAKGIPPEQLQSFINDGFGGAGGMATLLEQGFDGNALKLGELSNLFPQGPQLKEFIDQGFGDVNKLSAVVKTGGCSPKNLQELNKEFKHEDLKKLLDEGFGTPEAMGEVFRNGCKGKVTSLKELSTTFTNNELNDLMSDGCGDEHALGSLLGTGCNGEPAKLKTLNDAFSGDLTQLKEIIDGFGGEKCGANIRDVAKLHYGEDLAKLKTKLYDEVKSGFPASKSTREKLFKAAPSFKCKTANTSMMSVPFDSKKFTNVRIDHFLDRHSRDFFDFSDIKKEQTFWPPDFPVKEIERALNTMIAKTKDSPDFENLAVGDSDTFEEDLSEYGVKVKIGYKKYNDGDKLCIDMFHPTVVTGSKGSRQTATPEKFVKKEMNALKTAFGR